MSKARNLAKLLVDSNGDVESGSLDNVPASDDASALTTGTLAVARLPNEGLSLGSRNRIINGDMRIGQRGTSSTANSVANSTLRYDTIDRWGYWAQDSSKFTVTQSSTAPTGFSTSALITSSTALSVEAGTYHSFAQRIEGFNFSDFGFGTANAKSFTVSFWVRSSITGTFPFHCFNSGYSRSYVSTFTINAANTWEQKTITVAGDTSGTWIGATNGYGIEVGFTLAGGSNWFAPSANTWSSTFFGLGLSGATNFLATNGATFYITGVQLEVGSVATPFERRPYGTELDLCYRYYEKMQSVSGSYMAPAWTPNSTSALGTMSFYQKRANPTIGVSATSDFTVTTTLGTAAISAISFTAGLTFSRIDITSSGLTIGYGSMLRCQNSTGYIEIASEL
jgi:hypothetical protein